MKKSEEGSQGTFEKQPDEPEFCIIPDGSEFELEICHQVTDDGIKGITPKLQSVKRSDHIVSGEQMDKIQNVKSLDKELDKALDKVHPESNQLMTFTEIKGVPIQYTNQWNDYKDSFSTNPESKWWHQVYGSSDGMVHVQQEQAVQYGNMESKQSDQQKEIQIQELDAVSMEDIKVEKEILGESNVAFASKSSWKDRYHIPNRPDQPAAWRQRVRADGSVDVCRSSDPLKRWRRSVRETPRRGVVKAMQEENNSLEGNRRRNPV